MIESKDNASRNLEKALQALEKAKQRVANEKKKQNEKKRKAENRHKYIIGGISVRSPRGKFHLHGLLRRAVRQRQAHMGELQSPIGAKEPPLPPSVLVFRQKPKCGFYLTAKSMSAPRYSVGRM